VVGGEQEQPLDEEVKQEMMDRECEPRFNDK